jgi:hypothetical protein
VNEEGLMTTSGGSGQEIKREKRQRQRPHDDLSSLLIPTPLHPLAKPKIAKPALPAQPKTNTNAPAPMVQVKKEAKKDKERKDKKDKRKDGKEGKEKANEKKHAPDASLSSSSQRSQKKRKLLEDAKPGSRHSAREVARKEREEADFEREVMERVNALAPKAEVQVPLKPKERNV